MKKFIFILGLLLLAVAASSQSLVTKKFAFGAVGVDSITTGTQKYYYVGGGTYGTVASGVPLNAQVVAIQVLATPSVKATRVPDSVNFTVEISFDNTNWVKWTNAGATSTATMTNFKETPGVFGTNAVYRYAADYVTAMTTAGGGVFRPVNMYAPYVRIKPVANKASCSSYITAWVTYVKL